MLIKVALIRSCLLILALAFSFEEISAQVCPGGTSTPVMVTNFGSGQPYYRGTLNQPVLYQYVPGVPADGQYTIVKNTSLMDISIHGWHQVSEHTLENQDGYMMIVNGDRNINSFFVTTSIDVCPNTTYQFSAWLLNMLTSPGIKPNIRFTIETIGGVILKSYDTGDIPETASATWAQYGVTYKNLLETKFILRLTTLAPKGIGNDFAIDDIEFRACGPLATASIDNNGLTAEICTNTTHTFTLTGNVGQGYADPAYQWQYLDGNTWIDINGETNLQTTVTFDNKAPGIYNYRLTAAERLNIASIFCRTLSPVLTITVKEKPLDATNSGSDCEGTTIELLAGLGDTYQWTGPNGFTSTLRNPKLTNVTLADAGSYEVTVTNSLGCTSTSKTDVNVLPKVNPVLNYTTVQICENQSIQLKASGGVTYHWLPIDGLSDPSIADPIASPKQRTTYTVTISNGQCTEKLDVTVDVLTNPSVDAGLDKKILLGQSTSLVGKVDGDQISYFWTPSTYLDDPTKLNPVARPPDNITYTLHVTSNCGDVSDEVYVKVYQKLEIPNSFTPNGDGINDTWNIPAVDSFVNPRTLVVNRYGQTVFESYDNKPWDGKSKGKDLPAGAYFYTLYINKDYKTYAGWLFIIR